MLVKYDIRFFYLLSLLLMLCCSPMEEPKSPDDKLLATVFNKSLYLSDLKDMVPEGSSPEDSLLFVNAFAERWVRETLLMHEAEKHSSQDQYIDQLVKDYRSSLILYNYEKMLIDLQLDSTVAQPSLEEYYKQHIDDFTLEQSIMRCYFIKLPREIPDISALRSWWKQDDENAYRQMLEFCSNFAEVYMLEDSVWYKRDDIQAMIPSSSLKNKDFKAGANFDFREGEYQYFLKIFEMVSVGENAPLSYVEDQIKRMILHKNKIELLDSKKEEIYEREIRRNNVKIYTQ